MLLENILKNMAIKALWNMSFGHKHNTQKVQKILDDSRQHCKIYCSCNISHNIFLGYIFKVDCIFGMLYLFNTRKPEKCMKAFFFNIHPFKCISSQHIIHITLMWDALCKNCQYCCTVSLNYKVQRRLCVTLISY